MDDLRLVAVDRIAACRSRCRHLTQSSPSLVVLMYDCTALQPARRPYGHEFVLTAKGRDPRRVALSWRFRIA
jgi:hypothetical protein